MAVRSLEHLLLYPASGKGSMSPAAAVSGYGIGPRSGGNSGPSAKGVENTSGARFPLQLSPEALGSLGGSQVAEHSRFVV